MNLNTYMKANDIKLRENDLLAIIRRIDTNGDACLDFNEFNEFLKPLSKDVGIFIPPPIRPKGYGYPKEGSPLRNGGSPVRAGPPFPGPMPPIPPHSSLLFVTPPGTKKD